MALTILYPDSRSDHLDIEQQVAGPDTVFINPRKPNFAAIELSAWESADAIVTSRLPITRDVIPHLKRTRLVVRNGVGFDVVDLEACGAAGIPVCNVPDYGTTEVADSAVAMMLTFARGTMALDAALRADLKGGWTHIHNVTARRLRGACYGVIGLGRIGTASALRARAFGMNIAFYDPYLPNGAELALGFTRTRTLQELLGMADVITIHAPLTDETRKLIDGKAVAALVAAWQANEPWIRGRALLGPHAGFYSPDSFVDLRRKAIETAWYYLRDGKLTNCVNAEFLKHRR
jgi:phosphoglycerate dehydrogenase-like enzyme